MKSKAIPTPTISHQIYGIRNGFLHWMSPCFQQAIQLLSPKLNMSSLKKNILNDFQDCVKILVLRVYMLRSKVEDKISKVKIEDEILKVWVGDKEINLKVEDQFIECKIQSINKVYKERFSKYLYYCWIAKHVISQVGKNTNKIQICIFQHAPINYNLIFTPIANKTTTNENPKVRQICKFLWAYFVNMANKP